MILGSSNATEKALGPDCGEMNVYLSGRTAEAAWSVMEEYWTSGTDVDRAWLKKYARAHAKYERLAAKPNALIQRWRGASKRKYRHRPWDGPITVTHTYPFTTDEWKEHQQRVKAAKADGVEVPNNFVSMTSRKDATALSRAGEVLQLFWRDADDVQRGLKSVAFIQPGAAQKVGNIRLGQRWLVGFRYARGTRITLKVGHRQRVEGLLETQGHSSATFEGISGRLRGRRKLMKNVYTGLRQLAASRSRRSARR